MKKKIDIIIDPGHPGGDGESDGCIGVGGMLEKNINLEIAGRLAWYLSMHDITWAMTRYSERKVPLLERTKFANMIKCKLFLSIHCNYFGDSRVKGLEVWHWRDSVVGKRYAEAFQSGLANLKYTRDRGVKTDDPKTLKREDFYHILKKTNMPAVIVEPGFLSNPDDAKSLNDPNMQMIIAENLKETIKNLYIGKFNI